MHQNGKGFGICGRSTGVHNDDSKNYPGRYYGGRWFADRYYPRSVYESDLYYPRYYYDREYLLPREYYYCSSYASGYVPRYHHLDYVPRYSSLDYVPRYHYDSYYYPRYSSYWRY